MDEEKVKQLVFVKDFVYGSIDGIITTFAVVSGVIGAGLSSSIIIIMGIANLIADGFSMGVGNYLSVKSDHEVYEKERKREMKEIKTIPDEERAEIEKIYLKKGFKGNLLKRVVETITGNKRVWVDTMMKEELGLIVNVDPIKSASVTFLSFIFMGLVPLLTFLISVFIPSFQNYAFTSSIILTFVALFLVGIIKGKILKKKSLFSGFQSMIIGGVAAIIAYGIGFLLKG